MRNKDPEGEWRSLWKKIKLYGAIGSFLTIDLAFVLLWGIVLLGFQKAIHLIDPTGTFWLLTVIQYISEFSTAYGVVYSIIKDTKRITIRINQEHLEIRGMAQEGINAKVEYNLEGSEEE